MSWVMMLQPRKKMMVTSIMPFQQEMKTNGRVTYLLGPSQTNFIERILNQLLKEKLGYMVTKMTRWIGGSQSALLVRLVRRKKPEKSLLRRLQTMRERIRSSMAIPYTRQPRREMAVL